MYSYKLLNSKGRAFFTSTVDYKCNDKAARSAKHMAGITDASAIVLYRDGHKLYQRKVARRGARNAMA